MENEEEQNQERRELKEHCEEEFTKLSETKKEIIPIQFPEKILKGVQLPKRNWKTLTSQEKQSLVNNTFNSYSKWTEKLIGEQ